MKLFGEFEAIEFPEENMILITRSGYLYYYFKQGYKLWRKHYNAGNDFITVCNYPDVSRTELANAMHGAFPQKETDFMRLCNPATLSVGDMIALLKDDYAKYMSDYAIYHAINSFLLESDIRHKSFEGIQKLLEAAAANYYDNSRIVAQIKELSLKTIGRDIFKRQIGIVDGHDGSSYFWFMPVRVIDYTNTNEIDSVAKMRSCEISIEEDDVSRYLTLFLYKYFDDALEANKRRIEFFYVDDDGKEQAEVIGDFEWYLTHNFYTFDSMQQILADIADTVDALISGRETEYTQKLKNKLASLSLYAGDFDEENVEQNSTSRSTKIDSEVALVVDFYQRFIYRIEYMMKVGKEKGYDLISVMGP